VVAVAVRVAVAVAVVVRVVVRVAVAVAVRVVSKSPRPSDFLFHPANRLVSMFFNPNVSIEEEIYQAAKWSQSQRESERRAKKLIMEWKQEMNPVKRKNEVTPEMIDRAKVSPIENMIEVVRGVAHCISGEHADKRPSMRVKNNRARCFSCGFKEDAIGVAMKLHGYSFHDAVRALQ